MTTQYRKRPSTRLGLDFLERREVPAALVDLTSRGASGSANGAIFRQTDAQPTGSGVIHSFVRLQADGSEQGYNTDARPLQLDENKSPTFTRSLTLGEVPVVNVQGTAYREFLLDINQKSSSPLLSLDELRVFVGSTGNLAGYDANAKTLAGLRPVFDLDGTGDATVKMDYRLNPGSGGGDAVVLIPDSAFAGRPASSFVYLYSKFGSTFGANSGFEEWAVRGVGGCTCTPPSAPPPQPGGGISGTVVIDSTGDHVINAGDAGFGGVEVDLVDATGAVIGSTHTASDGTFSFNGLSPAAYTVQVVAPTNEVYGVMYPTTGTGGGSATVSWTGISGITVGSSASSGYVLGLYVEGQ